jgi:hypothetical protein
MGLLNRILPSTLFPVRLSDAAERRLRLAQARAEESVLETHVRNALLFVDTLAGELPFDRAIETYIRMLGIPEPLASAVATRTLVVLGDDVVPERELLETSTRVSDDVLPVVRLRQDTPTAQALPAR